MSTPLSAPQVLDREFLELRAKILELAASLDRLDRAAASVADDSRLARLQEALEALRGASPGRAEQVQLIFSREYEAAWREKFGLGKRA